MLLSGPRYTSSKTDQIHWMYSKPIQPDQGKWLRRDGMHQARQGQQNSHLTMPTSIIEEQGWYYPGSTTSTPTTGYGTSKWQRRLQHAHNHTRSRAWHGFCFEVEVDFHDHIHPCYGWPLDSLPSACHCGEKFSVDPVQICKLSGFIHMHHDEVNDFLAACIKSWTMMWRWSQCYNLLPESISTAVLPTLSPMLEWTSNWGGFWIQSRNVFLNTRVFYSHASSYRSRPFHVSVSPAREDKEMWVWRESSRSGAGELYTNSIFS